MSHNYLAFVTQAANYLLTCLTLKVASMKNIILKKDEEIERLKVGGIHKQNQKPPSGNYKHLEADTKPPMDDHIQQNKFLHQSKIVGGDMGKNTATNSKTLGFADANYHERSNDISNHGLAQGTDSDGSSENSSIIEDTKTSHKMEK